MIISIKINQGQVQNFNLQVIIIFLFQKIIIYWMLKIITKKITKKLNILIFFKGAINSGALNSGKYRNNKYKK